MTESTPLISTEKKPLTFEFRGDGMEYFKIWIVNVLLTIVTLGIYSAWAKVRSKRYFYSNLYLDDSNFRYLAEPLTILKGRIVAIVAFIIYLVISQLFPVIGIALSFALLIAMPYFMNQSLAFNARMSAYKNIQFRFKANYGQAFMALVIWPILGVLSLGLLYPLVFVKMNEYTVNNSAYGTSKFNFSGGYKDYGKIFLVMIAISLVIGLPAWALMTFVPFLSMLSSALVLVLYFGLILYFVVSTANLFYARLSLVEHTFDAQLTMPGLASVMLINLCLIIITLGLYLPAAKVRMTKYMCSCINMNAANNLDNFSAAEQESISALGEEFGQVFDFA